METLDRPGGFPSLHRVQGRCNSSKAMGDLADLQCHQLRARRPRGPLLVSLGCVSGTRVSCCMYKPYHLG